MSESIETSGRDVPTEAGQTRQEAQSIDFLQGAVKQLIALRGKTNEQVIAQRRHIIETLMNNDDTVMLLKPDEEVPTELPEETKIVFKLNQEEYKILLALYIRNVRNTASIEDVSALEQMIHNMPIAHAALDLAQAYPESFKMKQVPQEGNVIDFGLEEFKRLPDEKKRTVVALLLGDPTLGKRARIHGEDIYFHTSDQENPEKGGVTDWLDITRPEVRPYLPSAWENALQKWEQRATT